MSDQEATYEEYKKATDFARWKYKYGLFVLIACWICIVLLIVYVVMYAKELSTNPGTYMLEKFNMDSCNCLGEKGRVSINKTAIVIFEDLGGSPLVLP